MRGRTLGLVSLVLAVAADARAEPAASEPPPELESRFWTDRTAGASAYAALDGGTRVGGGLALGGALSVGGPGCQTIVTGGQVAGRVGGSAVSATHTLRACLALVRLVEPTSGAELVPLPIWIDHELQWNAVPRLAARRLVWNRPYTGEHVEADAAVMSVEGPIRGQRWALRLFTGGLGVAAWWQPLEDARVVRTVSVAKKFALVDAREVGDGGRVALFTLRRDDRMTVSDAVALDQFPLGSGHVRADAAIGATFPIDSDAELPGMGGLTGRLGLTLAFAPVRVGVGYGRAYDRPIDAAIIDERRWQARAAYVDDERGRAVAVTAFHAESTLIPSDGGPAVTYPSTYGVGVEATWRLSSRLEAWVDGAWGRSFYAAGGAPMPVPSMGVEVSGQLRVTYDR